MDEPEEIINKGIAALIQDPERDLKQFPLTQTEIAAVLETLMNEVNDPRIDETLANFYISCIELLKTKIFLN